MKVKGAWLLGATCAIAACRPPEQVNSIDTQGWDRAVIPPSDARAAEKRAACAYTAGALPSETQGSSHPDGDEIPIDHIVVVMQENRSFDHYFQKLPDFGQPDVEVAPAGFGNQNDAGVVIHPHHAEMPCAASTPHSWTASHQQVDLGKMDGFVKVAEGESEKGEPEETLQGERAMEYFDERDLPFYYWLASEFSIADHYHASVLGPTWPNRMYLYSASSFGHVVNAEFEPAHTIFEYMDIRGVDYKLYFSDRGGIGDYLRAIVPDQGAHVRTMEDYFADAAAGTLPEVAFVNSTFNTRMWGATWEHAPQLPALGERWAAQVIDALVKSPVWNSSALFLTYDEHGGLWDHVPPPPACAPDGLLPQVGKGDPPGGFNQYGVRVPMIAVSPFVKRHYVSHEVYDHTSILRFIEARFKIPALSGRDANATAPWEMFDFEGSPHVDVPAIAVPEVDPSTTAKCAAMFPKN